MKIYIMKFAATCLMTLSAIVGISEGASANVNSNGEVAKNTIGVGGLALNKVIDHIAEKFLVDKNPTITLETKLYLEQVSCAVTQAVAAIAGQVFVLLIKKNVIGTNVDLETHEVSMGWKRIGRKWVKIPVPLMEMDISPLFQTTMLHRADIRENHLSLVQGELKYLFFILAGNALGEENLVALDDSAIPFADEAQALRIAKDLLFSKGKGLPNTYNTDFNMRTDESFSRIFFHGIGAPLMAISDEVTDPEYLKYGPYMVDLEILKNLEVRRPDLFKNYGARIHFDENQMVSAIYDFDTDKLVLPGDPDWEEAKFQAKVSAFTLTTVREHLSQTHLIVSNNASREIVKTLHPKHPIRRLLAIFTYNAVGVNRMASQTLTPENSVIHRATALSFKAMKDVFDISYKTSIAYQPFTHRKIKNPNLEALANHVDENNVAASKFPYLSEGREFYVITRNMVKEWLKNAGEEASDNYAKEFYEAMRVTSEGQEYELPKYSHDNMVDLISTVIFGVTAYHELIGHVPDYCDSPFKAGFRVPRNAPTQVDFQSFFLTAGIAGATSFPAPQLMAEFPNYIGAGGAPEWEKCVWTNFISDMGLQSKKVQHADWVQRDFQFKYFDPSLFECSVSV